MSEAAIRCDNCGKKFRRSEGDMSAFCSECRNAFDEVAREERALEKTKALYDADLTGKQIAGWKVVEYERRGRMVDIKFEHMTSKEIKEIREPLEVLGRDGISVLLAKATARPPESWEREYDTLACDKCKRVFTRTEIIRAKKEQNFADEIFFKCECGQEFKLVAENIPLCKKCKNILHRDAKGEDFCPDCECKIDEPPYDSTIDTIDHIHRVKGLLERVGLDVLARGVSHDATKLLDPEKAIFDEFTPKLKGCTYGSDEYKGFLKEMSVALDHHYRINRHHPEHFPSGIDNMNLIDLLEMLADWKAASERHADGDIHKSLEVNMKRFNISPALMQILANTVFDLGWGK